MKTLMTAVLLTGLTIAGFARAEEPVKQPVQAKKVTLDELRTTLENMGYELKPSLSDGKTVGYHLSMERSGITVYGTVWMSSNGESIWIYGTLARTADANTPAEALLAMLTENWNIAPAIISHDPQTKKFKVSLVLQNSNITPATLRVALNQFATGVSQALGVWDKAIAKSKEKKEGKAAPSPQP